MVRVCDRCRKEEFNETIKVKGKTYDLCDKCLGRIEYFLNNPDKTFGDKIGGLFK